MIISNSWSSLSLYIKNLSLFSNSFSFKSKNLLNLSFKPLKEFKLDPGYERLWRIVVSAENVQPLVAGVAKVEEMIRAQGDDVNIGVFQPIAGGTAETRTLHLRASSRSWAMAGRLTDEFFAGKPWAAAWTETIGLIDTIESDTLEYCELVHSAES